jgi:hypothetical protein
MHWLRLNPKWKKVLPFLATVAVVGLTGLWLHFSVWPAEPINLKSRLLRLLLPPGYMAVGYFIYPAILDIREWGRKQPPGHKLFSMLMGDFWILVAALVLFAPARILLRGVVQFAAQVKKRRQNDDRGGS